VTKPRYGRWLRPSFAPRPSNGRAAITSASWPASKRIPVRSQRITDEHPEMMRSQLAIGRALRSRLKHLPPKVVRNRFALATTLAIQAVALRRLGANAKELSALVLGSVSR